MESNKNNTDKITLYGDLFSQPVRAVYAYLKIEGIEFTFKEVDLIKGENK